MPVAMTNFDEIRQMFDLMDDRGVMGLEHRPQRYACTASQGVESSQWHSTIDGDYGCVGTVYSMGFEGV